MADEIYIIYIPNDKKQNFLGTEGEILFIIIVNILPIYPPLSYPLKIPE